MPTPPATAALHPRAGRTPASIRRTTALAGAALATMILLGGCDDTAPTAAAARTTPSASRAAAFEHVGPQHGDEAGVAATAAAWNAAWNAGDADALTALFVDDAEFVNGRGQVAVGAAEIRAQHAGLFAGPFQGSHLESSIRRVTFLSGTAAVLDLDTHLTGISGLPPGANPTAPGEQRGRHKRVLVKRGGTWRIALMQITTLAPVAVAQ